MGCDEPPLESHLQGLQGGILPAHVGVLPVRPRLQLGAGPSEPFLFPGAWEPVERSWVAPGQRAVEGGLCSPGATLDGQGRATPILGKTELSSRKELWAGTF